VEVDCIWSEYGVNVDVESDLTADSANLPPVPASRTAENVGPFAVLLFKEVNIYIITIKRVNIIS
jgi:hypothetical protein